MTFLSAITGTPRRIRAIERFGFGNMNTGERDTKIAKIRALMEKRTAATAPMFSVVVPMHKEERYMLGTLLSLAEQTNQSAEFLIICNGEQKGSLTQTIAEAAGFRVLHVRKAGVARARQAGLKAARGKIVVTTDGDTLHDRHWLDAIASEWERNPLMAGGFGPVHTLSGAWSEHLWTQAQNFIRGWQGSYLFFSAAEANSWFLKKAAMTAGGYEIDCNYSEGSRLLKRIALTGELHPAQDPRTGVYTSDRRSAGERAAAMTKYLMTLDPRKVKYEIVR